MHRGPGAPRPSPPPPETRGISQTGLSHFQPPGRPPSPQAAHQILARNRPGPTFARGSRSPAGEGVSTLSVLHFALRSWVTLAQRT